MAFNYKNKHIINKVRQTLVDITDVSYSIEEKVDIVNNALNMFAKYIWNTKKYTIAPIDNSYTLPTGVNQILNVLYTNISGYGADKDDLIEDRDFYVLDNKMYLKFYGINTQYTGSLDVFIDEQVKPLYIEDIGNLITGIDVKITCSSSNFDIGEYILIKDGINEEVVVIKDKTETSITVDLTKDFKDAYVIGNAKINEKYFEVLCVYAQYYNASKKSAGSGQIKSESYTQGGRSKTISYANSTAYGEVGEQSLDLFVSLLKNDVNYKFKKFKGFTSFKMLK